MNKTEKFDPLPKEEVKSLNATATDKLEKVEIKEVFKDVANSSRASHLNEGEQYTVGLNDITISEPVNKTEKFEPLPKEGGKSKNATATDKLEKDGKVQEFKDVANASIVSHLNEGEKYTVALNDITISEPVNKTEKFDPLPKEEGKKRLGLIVTKMDLNKDGFVDRNEMTAWILRSLKVSDEGSEEVFEGIDKDGNGFITWNDYLLFTYSTENETTIFVNNFTIFENDKLMYCGADRNKDGKLNQTEFVMFQDPEHHPEMFPFLLQQSLKENDSNGDGKIDLKEYLDGVENKNSKDWLESEKLKFENYDKDKNGFLVDDEILTLSIQSNDKIASEEVDNLYASSDDDHDERLSYKEIVDHYDTFIDSDATAFGLLLEDFTSFDDDKF